MPITHEWPGFRSVVSSGFFPVKRYARSRSIFAPVEDRDDLGVVWRASVTLRPAFDNPERGAIESFIRGFAPSDYLRFWDLDYAQHGPYGSARSRAASVPVTWSIGAQMGAAVWRWQEDFTLARDLAPGDLVAWLRGAVPGETVALPGDTFGLSGDPQSVAFVKSAGVADPAGRVRLVLEAGQGVAGQLGDQVEFGKPFRRLFLIENFEDLANNTTALNALPSYEFQLIEVPDA